MTHFGPMPPYYRLKGINKNGRCALAFAFKILWLLPRCTSQSKVVFSFGKRLRSLEKMPKSILSLPKCCCLVMAVDGHFN